MTNGSMANNEHSAGRLDILIFATLAGLAATFVHGYFFGAGQQNQLCFLPKVLHALDPACLANDPLMATSTARVGVRLFFINIVVLLARVLSLPLACFVLTWFQNAAAALVTYVVAKELFDRSDLAAMVAVALTMSLKSIYLAGAAYLYQPGLDPQMLATGFALFGLGRESSAGRLPAPRCRWWRYSSTHSSASSDCSAFFRAVCRRSSASASKDAPSVSGKPSSPS